MRTQAACPAAGDTVNVVGMPEFDSLLDHIYEYGTAAEGVVERANALARAVIARYAPRPPAAAGEAAQSAEIEALRAEVDVLKAENARLREALQAIVDEVSNGVVPYSLDSYLPSHLVEQARAVLPKENSND